MDGKGMNNLFMKQIFETRMVAGVLAGRQEVVARDAAAPQAPAQRQLVATAQVQHPVPPQLVQGHDSGIRMLPEEQVALDEPGVARQAVQDQKSPHAQQAKGR